MNDGVVDPALVSVNENTDRLELVVNFGRFAGREASPAEVDRLAEALLPDLDAVEIVCEQRYRFESQADSRVDRVRVEVPAADADLRHSLVEATEDWARDCIAEQRLDS